MAATIFWVVWGKSSERAKTTIVEATGERTFLSRLFAELRGVLTFLEPIRTRLIGSHPRRSSQAQSLLLQLPIELLLEISECLPAESAVALELTCTSLFGGLVPSHKLRRNQQDELLQLLERDLSKQVFFCQRCHILHRFSPSWRTGYQDLFDRPCRQKVVIRDGFHLGFHLARLAMNNHLLGGGLNLEQLTCRLPNDCGNWNISIKARVIQDDLYLRVTHTLSLNGTGPENRRQLESNHHGMCNHVTTHKPRVRLNVSPMPTGAAYRQWLRHDGLYAVPQRNRIPELAPGQPSMNWYTLPECRNARGSCPVCLMDYSITTNKTSSRNFGELTTTSESWEIVITAYHQLGPCRSQFDWKWLTYATRLPDGGTKNMDPSLLGKRSRDGPYAPGSIQGRWGWDESLILPGASAPEMPTRRSDCQGVTTGKPAK